MGSTSLDWSLVQAFLAVAETGSLSAAGRRLGASQPTLGRQIRTLEEQLGVELFRRHDKGLALTEAGAALLPAAEGMRSAAAALELRAAGKAVALEGTVRVTAAEVVSVYHLPKIIAALRIAEPHIAIELVASDETSNLHYREADIAVRMYRPTQLDLVTQHLGDLTLGAFAAHSYVSRRGVPSSRAELLEHDFVGMDRMPHIVEGFRQAGFDVERDWFKVRADDSLAYWALVKAGCGIGFAQTAIGRADPELLEVPLTLPLPPLPIWLTAHEAIRRSPRVQRVWDEIAGGLRRLVTDE